MISRASASAWAAPPMSFFISRMPLAGLMSSPPLSKQTPLPTIAMRGSLGLAPFELDQARRALARRRAARPRRSADSLSRARRRAVTRTCAADALRARRGRPARARPGRGRAAGVLTRSRTSAVASASRTVSSIRAGFAGDQDARPALGLVLLRAVGVEAMLGEQPAERGLARARPRPAGRCLRAGFRRAWPGTRARASPRPSPRSRPRTRRRAGGSRRRSRSCRRSGAPRAARGPRRAGASPSRRSCPCRRGGWCARSGRGRRRAGKRNRSTHSPGDTRNCSMRPLAPGS